MLWLLSLHIAALLFWSATLLYLPALVAGAQVQRPDGQLEPDDRRDSMARFVFTHVATPAALLTILVGTLIFALEFITEPWLIVKLTLVAMLILCHALVGVLVLQLEGSPEKPLQLKCTLLAVVVVGLLLAIIWLVLAKPAGEELPWGN